MSGLPLQIYRVLTTGRGTLWLPYHIAYQGRISANETSQLFKGKESSACYADENEAPKGFFKNDQLFPDSLDGQCSVLKGLPSFWKSGLFQKGPFASNASSEMQGGLSWQGPITGPTKKEWIAQKLRMYILWSGRRAWTSRISLFFCFENGPLTTNDRSLIKAHQVQFVCTQIYSKIGTNFRLITRWLTSIR